MRQAVRWLAAVALTACLAASCGSSGGSAKPSTTTATPATDASPVTTRDELKDQILADYRKANNAYHDAINAGDPNLPSLEATHTGTNLLTVRTGVIKLISKGQRGKDGPHSRDTSRATVQQILEGKAIVHICEIDDGMLVSAADGRVVNERVLTLLSEATLEHLGGIWKVSENRTLKQWEGVAGCAG